MVVHDADAVVERGTEPTDLFRVVCEPALAPAEGDPAKDRDEGTGSGDDDVEPGGVVEEARIVLERGTQQVLAGEVQHHERRRRLDRPRIASRRQRSDVFANGRGVAPFLAVALGGILVVERSQPRVHGRLGIDHHRAATRQTYEQVGTLSGPVRVGRARLLEEVTVLGHAGRLDGASKVQLAPATARVWCSQCMCQVARRSLHAAHLGEKLLVGSGATKLQLRHLRTKPLHRAADRHLHLRSRRRWRLTRRCRDAPADHEAVRPSDCHEQDEGEHDRHGDLGDRGHAHVIAPVPDAATPGRLRAMRQRTRTIVITLATCVVVGGCGGADRVTYVDPNPESAYSGMRDGGTSEPFVTHGADDAVRAGAVRRLRGSVQLASLVAAAQPRRVGDVVTFLRDDSFAVIEPSLALRSPETANGLRRSLDALESLPASRIDGALAPTRRLLGEAELVAVPAEARQDPGFRAASLASALSDAALDVESIDGADDAAARASYWRAYAALLEARTTGLRDVPAQTRAGVGDRLAEVLSGWFADPSRAPETGARRVASDLNAIADDIVAAAGVDPVTAPPDAGTTELLQSLKRRVATAVESVERGDVQDARSQVEAAASTDLAGAASGLAAVDPALLTSLERSLVIDLPAAIAAGRGTGDVVATFDTQLDEAISVVEEELEIQREAT